MSARLPIHSFTVRYPRRVNALTTDVQIGVAFDIAHVVAHREVPPPLKPFIAIWDTGATHCAITKRVVDELGIEPISMAQVETAGGSRSSPVYSVCIALPNKVAFPWVKVTEVPLVGDADVLIGMDLIGRGDFAVTNSDGKTTLSFRFPSTTLLDFAAEGNAAIAEGGNPFTGVERNAPCPCGSGKKYKHCHMHKP
jgi:predicted aspartyl protease